LIVPLVRPVAYISINYSMRTVSLESDKKINFLSDRYIWNVDA